MLRISRVCDTSPSTIRTTAFRSEKCCRSRERSTFAGARCPAPVFRVPDVYLKVEYGNDYMTPLPPEDRRFRVQYIDF